MRITKKKISSIMKEDNCILSQAIFDAWCERAYGIACAHGFHDKSRSVGHFMMLVVTEISEMVEADRKNRHANPDGFKKCIGLTYNDRFKNYVKDTFEDEMADVIIRICDFCGMLCAYGGVELPIVDVDMSAEYADLFLRMTVCEQCYELVRLVSEVYDGSDDYDIQKYLGSIVVFLFNMARVMDIDLAWHIDRKMDYNEQRARMHGKQY